MKNFIIGFMLSWWLQPILVEVAKKTVKRLEEERSA